MTAPDSIASAGVSLSSSFGCASGLRTSRRRTTSAAQAKLEEDADALIGDAPRQLLGDLSDVAVLLVELYAGALTDLAALSGRGGAVTAWDAVRTLRESVARIEASTESIA
jgi:hypothetical protein